MFAWAPRNCRPLPPVITPVKVVLWAGITARSVIGTEVVSPPSVVSWTDADTSPGWFGSLVLTNTVPVPPGSRIRVDGEADPWVVKLDTVAAYRIGPLKPELFDSAKNAFHLPASG